MLAELFSNTLGGDFQFVILAAIFIAACGLFFVLAWTFTPVFNRRRAVRGVELPPEGTQVVAELSPDLEESQSGLRERIEVYYQSLEEDDENSLRRRLVAAGFMRKDAVTIYTAVRILLAMTAFIGTFVIATRISPESPFVTLFFLSFIAGALGLFGPNFYLDRMGTKQKVRYQRAFPDFMDMMIVCTDAGLSIEAAATRVSREFLTTEKLLGVHLCIMMLEVRAGKRFREALSNFADRLEIAEAKSLAILFRQSEELGSSLTQALRVYSAEMRQLRMLRAEEKANALPVKLVLPLAAFLFPVTMVIVVVPVMMTLLRALGIVAARSFGN